MLDKLKSMGRKVTTAYAFALFLLIAAWTCPPEKLSPFGIALAAIYASFAAGHAYTDVASTKTKPKEEEGS